MLKILNQVFHERRLIWELSVRGVQKNYFGSSLGILWLFIEQFVFISVLWVVFTKGLKFSNNLSVAFLPWFLSGYFLWIFISKSLTATPLLFIEYAYLLKKWRFSAYLIPIINTVQYLIIHSIFLIIFLLICVTYRIEVSMFWIQSIYYLLSAAIFMVSTSLLVSTVSLFVKDLKYFVAIAIQMGFWLSPIYWEVANFAESYHLYLKLNPVHYLIQGYRDSFIYGVPLWHRIGEGVYFWGVNIFVIGLSAFVYRKLRPQFGDVI